MINHPVFHVEPWSLREKALDLDLLAQTESVFALSNGHIGWRANLDEGEPHGLPGSYLNGVYESQPLASAEAAYGLPESGQTVVNVTNGKLIRLFVDDEAFDVRYGTLRSHERVLDFRSGVLSRRAEWVSPAGGAVRVSSARLVSFTQRAIAAVRYEVEPLDGPVRIALQSELLANEQSPPGTGDPRHGTDIDHPLVQEFHSAHDQAAVLVHRTTRSGLRIGAAMDHLVDGPDVLVESQSFARRRNGQRGGGRGTGAAAERDQVRRLRLVRGALAARCPGSGVGGPDRGPAGGLGWPAGRPARLPRWLLG